MELYLTHGGCQVSYAAAASLIWSSPMEEPHQPPSGILPIFNSQHQAADFLAQQQHNGRLKHCAHISIHQLDMHDRVALYQILCAEDSFEVAQPPIEFIGRCPKHCRLYQPTWRAALTRWRRNRHPVIWFEQQPWQVKVAVILAPLLALAIVFHVVKDLVALGRIVYEIIHGK